MIDNYSFGKIIIDGNSYISDVIIYPDKVDPSWWRKEGHSICMKDLEKIIPERPELIIFGKGSPGYMDVPENIQGELINMGFEIYISSTPNAVKKYNEIHNSKKTIAALHLTC